MWENKQPNDFVIFFFFWVLVLEDGPAASGLLAALSGLRSARCGWSAKTATGSAPAVWLLLASEKKIRTKNFPRFSSFSSCCLALPTKSLVQDNEAL
jgi:hypothetical protein